MSGVEIFVRLSLALGRKMSAQRTFLLNPVCTFIHRFTCSLIEESIVNSVAFHDFFRHITITIISPFLLPSLSPPLVRTPPHFFIPHIQSLLPHHCPLWCFLHPGNDLFLLSWFLQLLQGMYSQLKI